MNITAILHSTAFHQPEHIAIVDEAGPINYASLSAAVKNTAKLLISKGIIPGMGVGVMGVNSRDFIVMIYAVMETGAVVMPVSAQMSSDELQEIMSTSGFHALLHDDTDPAYTSSKMDTVGIDDRTWKLFFNDLEDPKRIEIPHVPHPALVRFTSGTTGASKGVLISHESIEARTRAANDALQLTPDDTVIWMLSMAYHFVVSIILYLRYGCTIVLCNSFHAAGILEKINQHKGTFIYSSPMHIRLLAGDQSGNMIPSVKRVISTSGGITKEHCGAFNKRYGIPVCQAFGIIEVGLPIINLADAESSPEAIGHTVKAYKVEILDEDDNPALPGTSGHLVIRGPGMFDAYLFPLRLRQEVTRNGWFYTGDLASRDEKGLIRIDGRLKSMINVAGNKVFPEEVEAVLNRNPSVAASRISGFQHHLLGEMVQAEIVLNEGENPDAEALRKFCLIHLSSYKVPQKFTFVKELPITDSGKIKR